VSRSAPVITRLVEFESADGAAIVGDLAIPETPIAGAIVCHPHPLYGGDRFNNVVSAVFSALPEAGIAALRFDFRSNFDRGVGERLDALGALCELGVELPDLPLVVVGYSFGAMVALGLDDSTVSAMALIAPPLAMATDVRRPGVATLVLTPRHDQFSPPAASEPIVAAWADAATPLAIEHQVIKSADHSLVGHAAAVADGVTNWLTRHLAG